MKKKDLAKLLTKTIPELEELLKTTRKELVQERLKLKKGELKDLSGPKKIRKDIAQILTIREMRKIEGEIK